MRQWLLGCRGFALRAAGDGGCFAGWHHHRLLLLLHA
jgi:hypothetical protein